MLKVIGGSIAAVVVIFLALPLFVKESPEDIGQRACETRIRLLSKNPTTVSFGTPRILAAANDQTQYMWTPASLQMQNGFGAMLGATALCMADRKTGEVTDLQLN